jgi:hypothetical protein
VEISDAPRDMFYCRFSRADGEDHSIMDLVIVRMGLKENPEFDFNGF